MQRILAQFEAGPLGRMLIFVSAIVLAALSGTNNSSSVVDPETAMGFVPQQAYHGGLMEDLNLFNFNLVATLPLSPTYPVSETLSYGLTAHYNGGLSWLAYHDPNGAWRSGYNVTDENSWLGVGWRMDFGKIVNSQSGNCSLPGSSIFNSWLAPGGFMHEFPFGQNSTTDGSDITIVNYVLRDGNQFCKLPTRLLMDHFRLYRNIDPNSGQVTRIEDLSGNGVDISYMEPADFLAIDPSAPASSYDYRRPAPPGVVYPEVTKAIRTVSDPFGRQILTTMTRIPGANKFQLTDVATPVFGDTPGSPSGHWSLVYEVRQITQPPVGWPSIEPGPYPFLPFLIRLELPADASGTRLTYTFDYNSSGELSEIRTPSGARTVYTWGNEYIAAGDRIVNNPAYGDPPRARVIATKEVYPAPYDNPSTSYKWSYVHNRLPSSGCSFAFGNDPWRAIVTDPEGNDTEYRFYGKVNDFSAPQHYGLPGAVKFYKGQALRWRHGMSSFDFASVDPAFPGTGQLLREVYYRPNSLNGGFYFFNRSTQTIYFDDRVNPAGSSMDPNGAWLQGWASACYAEREMNLPAGDLMFEGWAWHAETHDPNTLIGFSGYTPYETSYIGNLVGPATLQVLGDMDCNPTTALFPNRIVKVGGVAREYTQWSEPYCFRRFDPTKNYLIPPDRDTTFPGDVRLINTYTAGQLTNLQHTGGDTVSLDPNTLTSYSYTESMTYAAGALQTHQFVGVGWSWYTDDRTIDVASALRSASRDPAGVQTGSTYDALGRLTSVTPASPEKPTTITYLSESQPVGSANVHRFSRRVEVLKGSVPDPAHLYARYDYDGLGRLIVAMRRHADGSLAQQTHTYDGLDAPTFSSEWHLPTETNPPGTTISYRDGDPAFPPAGRRDPFGRPHRITDASGATKELTYFGLNEVATLRNINGDPAQVAVTKTYRDFRGSVRVVDAPEGADALYEYDHADRLTRVRLVPSFSWPSYDDPNTGTADLRADRFAVVPAGGFVQERTFTRDALGNLRQSVEPEKGTSHYLAYDPMGNPLLTQDNAGRLTRITRDSAARNVFLEVAKDPDTQLYKRRERYTYANSSTEAVGFGQALSRLIRAETFERSGPTPTTTREFIYSGLNGRLSEEKTLYSFWSDPPPWLSTGYSWNSYGFLDHLTYPVEAESPRSPMELEYSYQHGYLTEVGFNKETPDPATFTPLVTASYHVSGAPQSLTFSNGVVESTAFDPQGRVSSLQATHPPNPALWASGSYAYDGAGNLIGIGPQVYGYDRIGRLTAAGTSSPDPNVSLITSQIFGYDIYGSMNLRSGGPMGFQEFNIDAATNRLTSIGQFMAPYVYTDDGSIEQDHLYDYIYNDREKLTNVRLRGSSTDLESYSYDDRGWRTSKTDETAKRLTAYIRGQDGLTLTEYAMPTGTPLAPHWKKDYAYAFGRHIAAIENLEPEVPSGVTSEASLPNTSPWVSLAWMPVPSEDLYGYIVQRAANDPNGTYTRLTPVPITTAAYTDTDVALTAGIPYYYKLISVDTASLESRQTAPRKITPGDAVRPEPATNLFAGMTSNGVELSWSPSLDSGGDLAGYRVIRIGDTEPPMVDLAGLLPPGTVSYLDTTAQSGEMYIYEVRTFDTAGNMSVNNPRLTVTYTPTGGRAEGGCGDQCPPQGQLLLPPCRFGWPGSRSNRGSLIGGAESGPDLPDSFCLPGEFIETLADHTGEEPDWRVVFYHVDHLGTPRLLTDESGSPISRHAFFPFGEEVPGPWPIAASTNTHWFTGHERDKDRALDYMLSRVYNSTAGRFLSADPSWDNVLADLPLTFDSYTYANLSPFMFVDAAGTSALNAGCAKLAFWTIVSGTTSWGMVKPIEAGLKLVPRLTSIMKFRSQVGVAARALPSGAINGAIMLTGFSEIADYARECGERHGQGDIGSVLNELARQARWLLNKCRGGNVSACKALQKGCDKNENAGPTFPDDVCTEYREAKAQGKLPAHTQWGGAPTLLSLD